MGGHASGEVAARIAVEEMAEFYRLTGRDDDATWPIAEDRRLGYAENRLVTAMKVANQRIQERACTDERLSGMGTTLVCASYASDGRSALVGHVGDSRAYLYRRGALSQLTRDHSLLNDVLRARQLTPEEIENFPHKNVIVRALGMREPLEVELTPVSLEEGDALLLCCDGLYGMLPDARIAEIVRGSPRDLQRAAQALVDAANAAGGMDNVTCVLAQALG
jgi:serine/threonine protein phosphatase PrpC